MSIFEKLLKVQSEVVATKDAYNDFGNYKYRSCESILEAVKPILIKYKCSILLHDEVINIGERFYIKATAEFIDCELQENHSVSVSAFAREAENKTKMDVAQVTGSSSSYARKYALAGLLLLDDNRDPDATNKHGKDKKEEIPFPEVEDRIGPKEIKMLEDLFALEPDRGNILRQLLLKGKNVKELSKLEYGQILNEYNKHKNKSDEIQQRLRNGTIAFSKKANLGYDEAKQMIQDSLEVDFDKVSSDEIQGVINQIKAMIKDLSVSGEGK